MKFFNGTFLGSLRTLQVECNTTMNVLNYKQMKINENLDLSAVKMSFI